MKVVVLVPVERAGKYRRPALPTVRGVNFYVLKYRRDNTAEVLLYTFFDWARPQLDQVVRDAIEVVADHPILQRKVARRTYPDGRVEEV